MTSSPHMGDDRGCLRVALTIPLVLLTLLAACFCCPALALWPGGPGRRGVHRHRCVVPAHHRGGRRCDGAPGAALGAPGHALVLGGADTVAPGIAVVRWTTGGCTDDRPPLEVKQLLLAVWSTAVVGEAAVGADDAVAGNDDAEEVASAGRPTAREAVGAPRSAPRWPWCGSRRRGVRSRSRTRRRTGLACSRSWRVGSVSSSEEWAASCFTCPNGVSSRAPRCPVRGGGVGRSGTGRAGRRCQRRG
jgi:hypothetical protein